MAGRFTDTDLFGGKRKGKNKVGPLTNVFREGRSRFAYHDNAEPDKSGKTVANGAIRPS